MASMDAVTREAVKKSLKEPLVKYITAFAYHKQQPLDILIPEERKIRSLVGGLETSMGTTIWEPLAKTFAAKNGFEVVEEKILKPKPMPKALAAELAKLVELRESSDTWITAEECKKRLSAVCLSVDRGKVTFVAPPAGSGVDVLLKRDDTYYAFDIKTVQPNLGNVKSFNKQLLEWYAYSICKNPEIAIECKIAYPYNPNQNDFWTYTPHTKKVLEPRVDALAENEFWDFISGHTNTYQEIQSILYELFDEGFGAELSELIKKVTQKSNTL